MLGTGNYSSDVLFVLIYQGTMLEFQLHNVLAWVLSPVPSFFHQYPQFNIPSSILPLWQEHFLCLCFVWGPQLTVLRDHMGSQPEPASCKANVCFVRLFWSRNLFSFLFQALSFKRLLPIWFLAYPCTSFQHPLLLQSDHFHCHSDLPHILPPSTLR